MIDHRIEELMRKLLNNPRNIGEQLLAGSEIFFRVGDRSFSMLRRNIKEPPGFDLTLYFYPFAKQSLGELAKDGEFFSEDEMYKYRHYEASPEQKQLFEKLYAQLHKANDPIGPILDELLKKMD